MKLKKTLTALAVSSALMASTAAMATTITTSTGTYANFGGFDWASNGLAVVDNYSLTTAGTFADTTLTFWATAANILDPSQAILAGPSAGLGTSYEYTIAATVNERATCLLDNGAGVCMLTSFSILSGSTWDVYYDTAVNANRLLSTGYTDGVNILSGSFNLGPSGFFGLIDPTSGTGSVGLTGLVSYTDTNYINPSLTDTVAGSELKIGTLRTDDGFRPVVDGTDGSAVACSQTTTGTICLQADANQALSRIPEPGSLALLGLGLFGLGAIRRKASA